MANTQIHSLWVLLEGRIKPRHLRNLSFTDTDPDLSDLALQLGQIVDELASINASDLEFLDSDRTELRHGTALTVIEQKTSGTNPLVVRYHLSETTVVVNLYFSKNVTEVRLPHKTGLWYTLLAQSRKTYERLQDNQIYFVDRETETNIRNEFEFNDLMKKNKKLGSDGLVNLKLSIRIQGQKPYEDWEINDMLKDVLRDRYTSIRAIPQLDMRGLGTNDVLDEQEVQSFTSNLKKIASAFSLQVSTNEATARNFINPFMVEAVAKVKLDYPLLVLAVQQDFDGSRGYGFLDYSILYQDLAIVITEAKMSEMRKRIVQNIVQLHTAAEKCKRKRAKPPVIYGIVSTAKEWVFLRWSGTLEEPSVEISKVYDVSFNGDLPGTKDVLSIIIRILRAQASTLALQENGQDDERPTQKPRTR